MDFNTCFSKKFLLIIFINALFFANVQAQEPRLGWSFSYPGDNFTDDALLDLRYLNENIAGENGFIKLSEDGNSFVNGVGEPMRFWSINGGTLARNFSDNEMKKYARFLAKMGVNMIRFHGCLNPRGEGTNINDVDADEVNAVWKLVAAMKKEGIYTTISPFWASNWLMGGWVPGEWGIEDYSGKDDLWGVMFFSDTLKNAYKNWVNHLYTETNPYTGIALKDDPAVGIIQVKNEDGIFWWTIQNVKPSIKKIIRQKYYSWLIDKYGTISAAKTKWGNVSLDGDNPDAGEMDIYIIWYATENQSGGLDKRLTDQIQFMAEIQRNFYQEMYDFYRSIGCKQLINGNNWKTANAARLLDTERWTNSACDVLAVNRYYAPGHIGTNNGWRIDPGHYYQGKSVLFQPNKLPISIKQLDGHPMIVTESGWNLPHKYQAEGPFLISAYMSLTGVDGFYWFDPSSSTYDSNPYHTWTNLPGGQHPISRWTLSTPGQLGMFPANALLYRKGYLAEGKTTVYEGRKLESMWKRKIPIISEDLGFDPNRDTHNPAVEDTEISSLAYLTGKVFVKYGTQTDSSFVDSELNNLIDFAGKKVKSSTGELEWDYKNGVCTMDAPSSQGVCGFVGQQGTIELNDVTIETTNDYATINVVTMDDKTIAESSKILVQIGTVYQPYQWTETAADFELSGSTVSGFRIDKTGKMPWKCAKTLVTLKIKNNNISRATVLDAAGYSKSIIPVQKNENGIQIELPENAMYIILEKTTNTKAEILKKNSMNVFPNPNDGNFAIEIPKYGNKKYSLEIRNILGQKVWVKNDITDKRVEVNLDENYSGLLVIALKENNSVIETSKIHVN